MGSSTCGGFVVNYVQAVDSDFVEVSVEVFGMDLLTLDLVGARCVDSWACVEVFGLDFMEVLGRAFGKDLLDCGGVSI